ncbi:hypothetical protein NQ315_004715 [Exocentrus adspersus]|uniref:Uncharacterized protein n=1 Tax=Exocentrus adspersus TaxID=1586481 RepID=A0AAV8W3S1_9CUCU|nr:hypothetical protein NQ315_004715 [Exocentrus adspersus]
MENLRNRKNRIKERYNNHAYEEKFKNVENLETDVMESNNKAQFSYLQAQCLLECTDWKNPKI